MTSDSVHFLRKQAEMTNKKADEYVNAEQALEMIPFPMNRASMVRSSRTGAFPPIAIAVNARNFLWLRADIEKWIAEKSPRAKRVRRVLD